MYVVKLFVIVLNLSIQIIFLCRYTIILRNIKLYNEEKRSNTKLLTGRLPEKLSTPPLKD